MQNEKCVPAPMEALEKQADFIMKTVKWVESNKKLVCSLCSGSDFITDEDFKCEIANAIQEQDHIYYALLLYQKMLQRPQQFWVNVERYDCTKSGRFSTMLKKGVHARRILLRMPVVQCYNDSVAKRALEEQFRVNASKNSSNPLEKGGDPLFSKVRRYACHARLRKVWAKKKRRLRYRRY